MARMKKGASVQATGSSRPGGSEEKCYPSILIRPQRPCGRPGGCSRVFPCFCASSRRSGTGAAAYAPQNPKVHREIRPQGVNSRWTGDSWADSFAGVASWPGYTLLAPGRIGPAWPAVRWGPGRPSRRARTCRQARRTYHRPDRLQHRSYNLGCRQVGGKPKWPVRRRTYHSVCNRRQPPALQPRESEASS